MDPVELEALQRHLKRSEKDPSALLKFPVKKDGLPPGIEALLKDAGFEIVNIATATDFRSNLPLLIKGQLIAEGREEKRLAVVIQDGALATEDDIDNYTNTLASYGSSFHL